MKEESSSEDIDHLCKDNERDSNINVKAAFIHVIGDLLQSIGVLVAALIIYFKVGPTIELKLKLISKIPSITWNVFKVK